MRQIQKGIKRKSADNAVLSEFLTNENKEVVYVYDLGDQWTHIIKIEIIYNIDIY